MTITTLPARYSTPSDAQRRADALRYSVEVKAIREGRSIPPFPEYVVEFFGDQDGLPYAVVRREA